MTVGYMVTQFEIMPTNSETSFCSSRGSSPDGTIILDPFILLPNHMEHFRSDSIVTVDDKIFCSTCLEARSGQDIAKFEDHQYINYIKNTLQALDIYGNDMNIRKILLTLLSVILPKRSVDPQRDDRFHRVLRIFNKLMNSSQFDRKEFVMIVKIIANISIKSMQPIPLKSVWLIWKRLLDFSATISPESLLGPDGSVTAQFSEFLKSQATIIRTYIGLLSEVSSDRYSHHIFALLHQHEPDVLQKDHELSKSECLRFVQEVLTKNLEHLQRVEVPVEYGRLSISETISALHKSFVLSQREKPDFLDWLKGWDPIAKIHSMLFRDHELNQFMSLRKFLYAFVKTEIEKLYGDDEIVWTLTGIDALYTRTTSILEIEDIDMFRKATIFYLLLNRVAIQTKSPYYKCARVKSFLNIARMSDVRVKISESRLLMRVYAFMMTKLHRDPLGHLSSKAFVRDLWQSMQNEKRSLEFRELFCYELDVFEWAHNDMIFCRFMDFETIDYIIDRSLDQGKLNKILNHLSNVPNRQTFATYIKNNSNSLFEKMRAFGLEKIERPVLKEFSGWLPSLLQETILSYIGTRDDNPSKERRCGRIVRIIENINLLLAKTSEFDPHADRYFVMDFIRLLELLYAKPLRSTQEEKLLIVAHELIALFIDSTNLCVMRLIEYMEFTLLGYMYNHLADTKKIDQLTEAIAKLLNAHDELDHPIQRRIENSLFSMPESACEWMLSQDVELHRLSLIVIFKIFSENQDPLSPSNYRRMSQTMRLRLVTAFLQMLLNNTEMIRLHERRMMQTLKIEYFQCHPYFKYLVDEVPDLESLIEPELSGNPIHFGPTPDLTFDGSESDSLDDHSLGISKLLARLEGEEDVGLDTGVPENIFLSSVLDEGHSQMTDFPGSEVWERRAHEATQSTFLVTQRITQQDRSQDLL